jgi:dTDP-4-dehydrorhamnose 3,5-epimerase-like enzyme
MSIKVIQPFCNLETVKDGRGGIFTWLPEEPIVEFNLLFFKPGKTRGFHYHPHFIEYLLCVQGSGVLVTRKDKNDSKTETIINLSKGVCTRAEKNTYHTVYSITEMTLVAMLTNRWDDSKPPIIKVDDK